MHFLDAQLELTPRNPSYADALECFVWDGYEMDLAGGDISTKTFLGRASQKIKAKVTANQDGVLAGIQEAEWFMKELGIQVTKTKKDGSFIKKGDTVLELLGRASLILGAERTLLNLLQRMSGVASLTKKMSSKLPKGIKLLATRKTLWGLLDKRAVALGGGGTHRLNLSDAILIKENHIMLARKFKSGLKSILKKAHKVRFVEIEIESKEELNAFLETAEQLKKLIKDKDNIVVMLDNFSPADIRKVVKDLKKAGVQIELSGGINERNISRYNIGGVTAISSGALTTQAPNLDMSLDLK